MKRLTKKTITALQGQYRKMMLGILARPNNVYQAANNELGYTNKTGDIFLGFNHSLLHELNMKKHIAALDGVFAHEVMHQLLTDFDGESKYLKAYIAPKEQKVFHMICNVMEDSYIEYFAPNFLGEKLIRALNYMRAYMYYKSPKLNAKTPFSEFFQACIHYGDGGLVKGSFTFPEAKDCFAKAILIMDAHLQERDPNVRLSYVNEVFEITRCLWDPELKTAEFLKTLSKIAEESGHEDTPTHTPSPSGSPLEENTSETPAGNSVKEKRKEQMRSKMGKSSPATKEKSSSEGNNEDEGDANSASDKSTASSESDSSKDSARDDNPSEPGAGNNSSNNSNSEQELSHDSDPGSCNDPNSGDKSEGNDAEDDGRELLDSEELTEEELLKRAEELAAAEHEVEAEEAEEAKSSNDSIEFKPSSDGYKGYCKNKSCLNIDVKMNPGESVVDAYKSIVGEPCFASGIIRTANSIERIFRKDKEEKMYRTSGAVSISRLSEARVTARVFTRRKDPKNLRNVHIMLAVDESGSMHSGHKYLAARRSAIGLAEVFAKLGVQLSVLGFSADEGGVDVVHRFYLRGKNTLQNRLKLLSISARSDNFDGYTVRYCGEYLKHCHEEYKILLVISDGQPACYSYGSREDGIRDVKLAVKEVSKHAKVLGILLGDNTPTVHREMYGYNFLHIKNTEDLFNGVAGLIKKAIKDW